MLYLIPNVLAENTATQVIPPQVVDAIGLIRIFAVEEIREARRLLRALDKAFPIDESQFYALTKDTTPAELQPLLKHLKGGENVGIISGAGCPGVADPGAELVNLAQLNNIPVVPLVGPSSFLLALMASGFNGQQFTFNGYIPIDEAQKKKQLREMEAIVLKHGITQIFMDTPYRNEQLFKSCCENLNLETKLCIAADLTGKQQLVVTKTIKRWKVEGLPLSLKKIPAVFLLNK